MSSKQQELDEIFDEMSESDSESEEEEDEEGEELTPALDAAILRTLAKIRNKDESVYGPGKVLQEELAKMSTETPNMLMGRFKSSSKPFSIQDHQRLALLSGKAPGAEDDEAFDVTDLPDTIIPLSQVEEEHRLRAEVTSAFKNALASADADAEDDDGFLVKKDLSKAEVDKEQAAYRSFLLKHGGGEDQVRKTLGLTQDNTASAPALDFLGSDVNGPSGPDFRGVKSDSALKAKRTRKDDDEFLMNYILNRGWVDKEDEEEEVVPQRKRKSTKLPQGNEEENATASSSKHPWGELEAEDDFDDKAEEFETTYNFRFEEPGAANIVSHPRNLATTVRRTDDSRKTARELKKEREAAKAAAFEEETKRKKGKMRREIDMRLQALKEEFGEEALKGLDLEGDWDEVAHDKAMQTLLAADGDDDEKPTWDDDEEVDVDPNDEGNFGYQTGTFQGELEELEFEDDGPINMDADFIELPTESKKSKKKNKKGKNKNRDEEEALIDLDAEAELSAEAKKEKIKDALDEYRKLDHEDMIGDMPTRFKYAKSAPATFGLTPVEILMATDNELNSFLGMKHYAPYRHGLGAAGRDHGKKLRDLKAQVAKRKWGEEYDPSTEQKEKRAQDNGWAGQKDGSGQGAKKRKGKKERSRLAAGTPTDGSAPTPVGQKRKADGDADEARPHKK